MGNAAIYARGEIEHLVFERIRGERPAVAKDYRFAGSPILVVNLRAVFGRNRTHGFPLPRVFEGNDDRHKGTGLGVSCCGLFHLLLMKDRPELDQVSACDCSTQSPDISARVVARLDWLSRAGCEYRKARSLGNDRADGDVVRDVDCPTND
jgi:hypothetical protein